MEHIRYINLTCKRETYMMSMRGAARLTAQFYSHLRKKALLLRVLSAIMIPLIVGEICLMVKRILEGNLFQVITSIFLIMLLVSNVLSNHKLLKVNKKFYKEPLPDYDTATFDELLAYLGEDNMPASVQLFKALLDGDITKMVLNKDGTVTIKRNMLPDLKFKPECVHAGDLDCITVQSLPLMFGQQENVNMSNVLETIPVDIPLERSVEE